MRNTIYWYASDYCDVFLTDRIQEQVSPECSFATDIVMNSNLNDLSYLYYYGEYINKNELEEAKHLLSMKEEEIIGRYGKMCNGRIPMKQLVVQVEHPFLLPATDVKNPYYVMPTVAINQALLGNIVKDALLKFYHL